MARSALFAAAIWAAISLLAGCGETVSQPVAGVNDDSSDDNTGDDTPDPDQPAPADYEPTSPTTFTLVVKMGDIGDAVADVTVVEEGKTDASSVWSGPLARFETSPQLEVAPATYAITVLVEGFESWDISVPVNETGIEVDVPENELIPKVDYSWLNARFPAYYRLTSGDLTSGDLFEIDCQFDGVINCFKVGQGGQVVTDRSPTDPLVTLYENQGFIYDLDGEALVAGDVP